MNAPSDCESVVWQGREYVKSLLNGFFILIASFFIMNHAGNYATKMAEIPVGDIVLDNLIIRDVSFFHVQIAIFFWVLFTVYMLTKPSFIPFIIKTISLFLLVRSAFICMTHLGVPSNKLVIPDDVSSLVLFNGDLFFSGHVGAPFLMMLVFWQEKVVRYVCLSASIIFAYIVLVGHIHYSIDVFAAPFITYSIFNLSTFIFAKDYQRLKRI